MRPAKSQHRPRYRILLKLLRELREQAGLTQRDLAERVGRPQPWVRKSETGERRLDVTEFLAWSEACGVDPAEAFARLVRKGR